MAAASSIESEIKLRVADPEAARRALLGVGATLVRARHFEDNLLLDDGAGSLVVSGRALRVRRVGEQGTLTFKGPRQVVDGIKSREEIEVSLPDPDALLRLLARIGFLPFFRYQKYREVYRLGEVEVVVDETPIGAFLEIEGEGGAIRSAAAALGHPSEDFIADSYPALYRAAGGRGDMVFTPS
jgi:adenylate cyclase, class 2